MHGSGGGNIVCHLNTDSVESSLCCNSSGGTAFGVGLEVVDSSSKANEAGRGGKGSEEPVGNKGSKAKDKHSGTGGKQ